MTEARSFYKILFVHDGQELCSFVSNTLSHIGYEVVLAGSIDAAKDKLLQHSFKFILSERKLTDGTGHDMLNAVRRLSVSPFIMLTSPTEPKEAESNNLLNFISLSKPFREEDLIETLKEFGRAQGDTSLFLEGGQYVKTDEEFSKIDIDEFISGREIKYDIFINIGATKFVKLSHGNEGLSRDQIERLKLKGVHRLFMRKKDFIDYISMTVGLIKHMPKAKIPADRKSQFLQQTSKMLSESLLFQDLESEAIFHAKDIVDATINMLVGCDKILVSLELLKSGRKSVFSHSLNVALFSVMIARNLKWHSYLTQVKLAAGGMFHDIGKAKLPSALLDIPEEELNEGERQLVEDHVVIGVEILKGIKEIPPDVVSIVHQHHEEDSGKGYPGRLTRSSTLPLAKVVKIADDFCEAMARKTPSADNILKTLKEFEAQKKYETEYLTALKNCFKEMYERKGK